MSEGNCAETAHHSACLFWSSSPKETWPATGYHFPALTPKFRILCYSMPDMLKIALAQIDTYLGEVAANVARIRRSPAWNSPTLPANASPASTRLREP